MQFLGLKHGQSAYTVWRHGKLSTNWDWHPFISAVNNVYAVILLARALNERSRRLEKEYTQEALDYLDLALGHCGMVHSYMSSDKTIILIILYMSPSIISSIHI